MKSELSTPCSPRAKFDLSRARVYSQRISARAFHDELSSVYFFPLFLFFFFSSKKIAFSIFLSSSWDLRARTAVTRFRSAGPRTLPSGTRSGRPKRKKTKKEKKRKKTICSHEDVCCPLPSYFSSFSLFASRFSFLFRKNIFARRGRPARVRYTTVILLLLYTVFVSPSRTRRVFQSVHFCARRPVFAYDLYFLYIRTCFVVAVLASWNLSSDRVQIFSSDVICKSHFTMYTYYQRATSDIDEFSDRSCTVVFDLGFFFFYIFECLCTRILIGSIGL